MASKILILLSIIAVVNAGYKWVDDEDDEPRYKPMRMYVPSLPQPPRLPRGFPQPPPLMQPPPLYHFGFSIPPIVPIAPTYPFQFNIPSPGDIKRIKPEPGTIFNGISVKSTSGYTTDEDGNLVRTGGATVVLNDNGEVDEHKVGENPPDIDDPIVFPGMPEYKPFVFEPIKPVDINYKPKDGETYIATSSSSHHHSSVVDGVRSESGGSKLALNHNGEVQAEGVEYQSGDDPKYDD